LVLREFFLLTCRNRIRHDISLHNFNTTHYRENKKHRHPGVKLVRNKSGDMWVFETVLPPTTTTTATTTTTTTTTATTLPEMFDLEWVFQNMIPSGLLRGSVTNSRRQTLQALPKTPCADDMEDNSVKNPVQDRVLVSERAVDGDLGSEVGSVPLAGVYSELGVVWILPVPEPRWSVLPNDQQIAKYKDQLVHNNVTLNTYLPPS